MYLGSPKSYFIFRHDISHSPTQTFKLSHILDSIIWSILLLSTPRKISSMSGVFYQLPSHLPKFYPGSNSSSHTPSSIRLNQRPYPSQYLIFPSLMCSSIWYGMHHVVTRILANCAVVQSTSMNCQSIISSLWDKDWDLFIFVFITTLCMTLHIVHMQQIISWEND